MSQNVKLLPRLNQQSTRELNLTVLQRIDRHVEEILTTAAHVTFYEFNIELSEWSRKDVEGSLFVVKRRTQPRFQFIVMNRRSTENLVEDLLSDFEYEVQGPYLLYRNAAQEVNGIWFYNPRECEEVAKLFSRILNAFSKVPVKTKAFTSQSNEFQELEGVPTAAIVDCPLEPTGSIQPTLATVSDEPLEPFFSKIVHLDTVDLVGPTAAQSLSTSHPLPARPSSGPSPVLSAKPLSSPNICASSASLGPVPSLSLDALDNAVSPCTNLVKPSYFVPPPLLSAPLPPPLVPPPTSLQPSHGAPLLQPFPPPVPSPSLAPSSNSAHGLIITRDGVRDALFRLVQNEHFVDMVYREICSAHLS